MFSVFRGTDRTPKGIRARIVRINITVLLAFAVFFLLANVYFRRQIDQEFYQSNREELENITNSFDQKIQDTKKLLYQFAYDNDINSLAYARELRFTSFDNLYKLHNGIGSELKLLTTSRPDMLDILVYLKRHDIVLSTAGTSSPGLAFSNFRLANGGSLANLASTRRGANSIKIVPATYLPPDGNGMSVAADLFVYSLPAAALIVVLDRNAIDDLLTKMKSNNGSIYLAYDREGAIYADSVPKEFAGRENAVLSALIDAAGSRALLGRSQYVVFRKTLTTDDISYVLAANRQTLSARLNAVNVLALCLLAAFIVFDAILYIVMRSQLYRPLQKILRQFNLMEKKCEYVILDDVITTMRRDVGELKETLRAHEELVEEHFVTQAFSGALDGSAENGYELRGDEQYVVATVVAESANGESDADTKADLDASLAASLKYRKVKGRFNEDCYLITVDSQVSHEDIIRKVFTAAETRGVFCVAGLSGAYAGLRETQKAYRESLDAIEQAVPDSEHPAKNVFVFGDRRPTEGGFIFEMEDERKILNLVVDGDADGIRKALQAVFRANATVAFSKQRELRMYLADLLIVFANSKNVDMKKTPICEQGSLAEVVARSHNARFIDRVLGDSYLRVAQSVSAHKADVLTTTIIRHIEANYNKMMSLDTLADELRMSRGYVSTYFKKSAGINFTKYLHLKRVEKARELLRGTNLTVGEIAPQVGFENVNTFIRVFKKYEGVTPGQYRSDAFVK